MEKRCSVTPYEGDKNYCFVSFSHNDASAVIPILERLSAEGFRIWYDEGIVIGSGWSGAVRDHLNRASAFIGMISDHYMDSSQCLTELYLAQEKQIPILTVLLGEVTMPPKIKMWLNGSQVILKNNQQSEAAFYKIITASESLQSARSNDAEILDADLMKFRRAMSARGHALMDMDAPSPRRKKASLWSLLLGPITSLELPSKKRRKNREQEAPTPTPQKPTASPGAGSSGFSGSSSSEQPPETLLNMTGVDEKPKPELSRVQFSAVAPRMLERDEYTVIDVLMYEDAFRSEVDRLIAQAESPMQEKTKGMLRIAMGTAVTVRLFAQGAEIEENEQTAEWIGGYLVFPFPVFLPADYEKKTVLFTAKVYFEGVPAVSLSFTASCAAPEVQKPEVFRRDIRSAFLSYASADRETVATILQGIQKARKDLHVFFDVESLRSGENWKIRLYQEIDNSDILFLFWSQEAKRSRWVEMEWRYALLRKGLGGIDPIALEMPDRCPPPEELKSLHFNDQTLYIIQVERMKHAADSLDPA